MLGCCTDSVAAVGKVRSGQVRSGGNGIVNGVITPQKRRNYRPEIKGGTTITRQTKTSTNDYKFNVTGVMRLRLIHRRFIICCVYFCSTNFWIGVKLQCNGHWVTHVYGPHNCHFSSWGFVIKNQNNLQQAARTFVSFRLLLRPSTRWLFFSKYTATH